MKKVFLIAFFACTSMFVYAQDQQDQQDQQEESVRESNSTTDLKGADQTYVSKDAVIDKYHNEVELEKLGKLELTDLYLKRVQVLTEIMPYLALNRHPAGGTLKDLGIPETKSNLSHLEDEVKNKKNYLESVNETMHDIIPYADKGNIIWCILFLEDTLHKIEKSSPDN